jgi:hypothetical protein
MIVAQSYTFNPGVKGVGNVVLPAIVRLEDFGVITNVTRGSILYDPVEGSTGATVSYSSGNTILTFEQTTSYCHPSDKIQILILQGTSNGEPTDEVRITNSVLDPVNIQGNVTVGGGSVSISSLTPSLVDSFGRIRVSQPFNLFASSHRYSDNGYWSTATASGGSATFNSNEGLVDLAVGTSQGSKVFRETYKVFSYQPGKGFLIKTTFTFNPVKSGLRQRVGLFNDYNGLFLEIGSSPQSLCFTRRSYVSGSTVDTKVSRLGGEFGPQDTGWNIDKLDGNGPSGITIDPSKSQILFIDLEWLGAGTVMLGFMVDRKFVPCHTFDHANIITGTYMTTACLPVKYEIENLTSTTSASTLKQICTTVESEGGYELSGSSDGVGTPITTPKTLAVAGIYYPVVSLRLKQSTLDAIAILTSMSIMGLGNNESYHWKLLSNPSISDGAWSTTNALSCIEYNLGGTVSGGRTLASGFISSSNKGSPTVELSKDSLFAFQLERDGLNSTSRPISLVATSSNPNQSIYANLDWQEVSH